MPSPPIAVVDLGTNSTRLLVATVHDGAVKELERHSNVTRLGQQVDSTGRLAQEAIERVFKVLTGYKQLIDRHGATTVVALATSAVRDSDNGDDFRQAMKERFGFDARTISGDEEARLTFVGATSARGDDNDPTLVIDIGGGSTEFVIGRPGQDPDFHVSTQAGSVRQSERHLHDDPPTEQQLDELKREMREIIENGVPPEQRKEVTRGIAVAGTATQLASVALGLEPYNPKRVHGYTLTLDKTSEMLDQLGGVALEHRREIPGMDPDRAPTIIAGAAILVEAMRSFGLGQVEASETDILHGAALAASRA
jgi:exopolyphosphatase/guanosine-5'-triphosphate,3'-diphosphate pyrophosphatase